MTTQWVMIPCPDCEGRGTLEQLDVDRFVACSNCHGTGELEVEADAIVSTKRTKWTKKLSMMGSPN